MENNTAGKLKMIAGNLTNSNINNDKIDIGNNRYISTYDKYKLYEEGELVVVIASNGEGFLAIIDSKNRPNVLNKEAFGEACQTFSRFINNGKFKGMHDLEGDLKLVDPKYLEIYDSDKEYSQGDRVNIVGGDGRLLPSTIKWKDTIGYYPMPDNLEELHTSYKYKMSIGELVNTAISFSPIDTVKDVADFICGKDIVTDEKSNRLGLVASIILPGALDAGAKQIAKHSDEIGEFIAKNSDDITDVFKKDAKDITQTIEKVKYGEQYTRVNGKKVLRSNIEYETVEGYKYITDNEGRITKVEANLELGKADRNSYAQRVAGREDRLPKDDGGHLIASIFNGSGDLDNLVPMDSTLNRGEYRVLENSWRKALNETPPKKVEVKIKPIYDGTSLRPARFKIDYKIDGVKYSDILTN